MTITVDLRIMSSNDTTTAWLSALEAGDEQAARELWRTYYERLVRLAAQKLRGTQRRMADEEDVALSAFQSFFQGVRAGRFPNLADRDDLWKLLVVITSRKAADLVQHQRRRKRGGGAVRGNSVFQQPGRHSESGPHGWQTIIGAEPTPEFSLQVREELEQLLNALPDDELREIAIAKLEGYTNDEISRRCAVVPRTIERKLLLIRRTWSQESQS